MIEVLEQVGTVKLDENDEVVDAIVPISTISSLSMPKAVTDSGHVASDVPKTSDGPKRRRKSRRAD
jgi:hypothetical protein